MMGDPYDLETLVEGVRYGRRIFRTRAFAPYFLGEYKPGPEIGDAEDLAAHVRRSASGVFHPCGTCKMGSDAKAVVDARLRVRGLEGLRVADASIMPTMTSGNTNAPTIMIGEKAADMMREDARAGTRVAA
jgi:choline dehydrogenase